MYSPFSCLSSSVHANSIFFFLFVLPLSPCLSLSISLSVYTPFHSRCWFSLSLLHHLSLSIYPSVYYLSLALPTPVTHLSPLPPLFSAQPSLPPSFLSTLANFSSPSLYCAFLLPFASRSLSFPSSSLLCLLSSPLALLSYSHIYSLSFSLTLSPTSLSVALQ